MNDILFGNNNKAVIRKLTKRNFQKNRLRNIAAILAIAITAFLFTSIAALAFSMQSSILLSQQMQKGSKADGDIRYMTETQFEELRNSDFIEQAGCRQVIGFAANTGNQMIEINYADDVQQELTFCTPTHGSAPRAANEIATTDLALKALGADLKIGATVTLEFELRGHSYQYDMVVSGWWEAANSNSSLLIVSKNFMVENANLFQNTFAADKEMAGTYFSDVILKNNANTKEQLKDFARSVNGNPDDMNAKNFLLCTENEVSTEMLQPSTVIAAICFIVLFAVCGYLLIHNIFDIFVMQEVRQYGLLRTIGTSPRQIKQIVNRQAVFLTLIGLPIGLLSGFGIGCLLLPVAMKFLSFDSRTATQVSVSPLIFIFAAIFTILTVFISTRKPVKKAVSVSPLEAIRYTEANNNKKATVKRYNGAKLSHMAFSNLGRNKRRSTFIVISMLLCVVLFNSVIVITQSMDEKKWINRTIKTDFNVYNSACINQSTSFVHHADALDSSVVQIINQQVNVTNERYLYRNTIDDADVTVDYGFDAAKPYAQDKVDNRIFGAYENGGRVAVAPEENWRLYGNIFGASENFINDLIVFKGETNIDILKEKLKTGDYVLLGVGMEKLTAEPKQMPFDDELQIGDTVSFYKNGKLYKTCTILAKVNLVMSEIETTAGTLGASKIAGDAPYLYLPENVFSEIYEQPTLLSYGFNAVDKKEQASKFLSELTENNPKVAYTSTDLLEQQLNSIRSTVLIVGGIIGIIFALAGFINFTNMMITNIITRKHEFAVMQSIGMTKKQLRSMMIWEGLYYSITAGGLGAVIAVLLGLTVLQSALNSPAMWYFTLQFTIVPALIVSMIYLIIAFIVPTAVLHFFNKGTVVERLRMSE